MSRQKFSQTTTFNVEAAIVNSSSESDSGLELDSGTESDSTQQEEEVDYDTCNLLGRGTRRCRRSPPKNYIIELYHGTISPLPRSMPPPPSIQCLDTHFRDS